MTIKRVVLFLTGLLLVTSCAPGAATVAGDSAAYNDPFAYCAAVGTIDAPDARYSGPKTPESVVKGVIKASGAPADAPLELFSQGTFWRCMDNQVYACFVGANLPCESKANTSKVPSPAMTEFCAANPKAEFIPAYLTGHETVYAWSCIQGKAAAGKQVFQVDRQGFIQEIWYVIGDE